MLTPVSPASVNSSTFGLRAFFSVDGKVDAQPLFVSAVSMPGQGTHDVLYAVTEHDSVYALDAVTGGVLWRTSALGAGRLQHVSFDGPRLTRNAPPVNA
jgi:outer membrane protein assembly factor BamB